MSNYIEAIRSNEFKIKQGSKEQLEKILNNLSGEDVYTDIIEREDGTYGWLGCYGGLIGLDIEKYFADNEELIEEYQDAEYNAMVDELQKIIDENSALILIDAGHEKLRYVGGGALIITSETSKYIDLSKMASETAQKLIGQDK